MSQNNPIDKYTVETSKNAINENAKVASNYSEFSALMNDEPSRMHAITNINQIQIIQHVDNSNDKPQTNKYEFRRKDDNGVEHSVCIVQGQQSAKEFMEKYILDQKFTIFDDGFHDVQVDISTNQVIIETQTTLDDLKGNVQEQLNLKEDINKSQNFLKEIKKKYEDVGSILKRQDNVLFTKNGKLTPTEEQFVKLLRTKVADDLRNIAQLDLSLTKHIKTINKGTQSALIRNDIENINNQLTAYNNDHTKLSSYMSSPSAFSSYMETADFPFEIKPSDQVYAQNLLLRMSNIDHEKRAVNSIVEAADLKKISNEAGENLYDYLTKVANGDIDPSQQKFVVAPAHVEGFKNIAATNKALDQFVTYVGKVDTKTPVDQVAIDLKVDPTTAYENKNSKDYKDTKEAFEKGGIKGVIDHALAKTNMSPKQREFRGGAADIAAIGGGIWLGWKFLKGTYKSIFGGEEGRKEGLPWMIGGIAAIVGSQAITGRNPRDIMSDIVKGGPTTNRAANIFSGDNNKGGKENVDAKATKEELTYAKGFPAMAALFNGMKYSEMQPFIQKENGKLKLNTTLMKQSARYQTDDMTQIITFIEKNDKKDVVDLALTGMGIDENELINNPDKQFSEVAKDALDRVVNVYRAMSDGGYDVVSNEGLKLVREYIKKGSPDISVLVGKGIFEKSDEKIVDMIKDNQTLKNTIIGLPINDKEQLTKSINTFLAENKTAGFDITVDKDKTYIKNYSTTTKIDFANKVIENNGHKITCDTYTELIRAATLTNFLKNELAHKSKTDKPFYEGWLDGDIKFDDGIRYKPDTDAVTSGKDRNIWGVNLASGKLDKLIPALAANKKTYLEYLNSFDIWKQK